VIETELIRELIANGLHVVYNRKDISVYAAAKNKKDAVFIIEKQAALEVMNPKLSPDHTNNRSKYELINPDGTRVYFRKKKSPDSFSKSGYFNKAEANRAKKEVKKQYTEADQSTKNLYDKEVMQRKKHQIIVAALLRDGFVKATEEEKEEIRLYAEHDDEVGVYFRLSIDEWAISQTCYHPYICASSGDSYFLKRCLDKLDDNEVQSIRATASLILRCCKEEESKDLLATP
jgi:hypothetical protein